VTEVSAENTVSAMLERAANCWHSGDLATARALCMDVLEKAPEEHHALHVLGYVALKEQQPQEALECFERALQQTSDSRSAAANWRGAGQVFYAVGDIERAEEALRNAIAADPASPAYPFELGDRLAQAARHGAAVEAFRDAARLDPRNPEPLYRIGNSLVESRRYTDAIVFYDRTLQLAPHSANTHFNRGTTLQMMGQLDEAHAEYSQALELDPQLEGYYHFSQLHTFTHDDPYIAAMQSRVAQGSDASLTGRIDAGYGLANALHQLGDYNQAFSFLEQASRLKRSTFDYALANQEAQAERIMSFLDEPFIRRFENKSAATLAPIFIIGMPRSGSTLLEQMLAAHSGIHGGGELFYISEEAYTLGEAWGKQIEAGSDDTGMWLDSLNQTAQRYAQRTAEFSREAHRFTDKMPTNFFYVGLIHLLFPCAHIIHCRRHPLDICLSCYQHLFGGGNEFSYDLTELGQYYRLYDRVMRYWCSVLPGGRILDVDYEAIVAAPEDALRRVLNHCGLDYESACLEFHTLDRPVKTASSVQVRQPLYRSAVNRWTVYRQQLAPLIEALGELAGELPASQSSTRAPSQSNG
jgi:tetratricopeptide (TPR) repeat protein